MDLKYFFKISLQSENDIPVFRCHRRFAPQEVRPPSQKGGDIPRIFAPPRGESPRNIAPL